MVLFSTIAWEVLNWSKIMRYGYLVCCLHGTPVFKIVLLINFGHVFCYILVYLYKVVLFEKGSLHSSPHTWDSPASTSLMLEFYGSVHPCFDLKSYLWLA